MTIFKVLFVDGCPYTLADEIISLMIWVSALQIESRNNGLCLFGLIVIWNCIDWFIYRKCGEMQNNIQWNDSYLNFICFKIKYQISINIQTSNGSTLSGIASQCNNKINRLQPSTQEVGTLRFMQWNNTTRSYKQGKICFHYGIINNNITWHLLSTP